MATYASDASDHGMLEIGSQMVNTSVFSVGVEKETMCP